MFVLACGDVPRSIVRVSPGGYFNRKTEQMFDYPGGGHEFLTKEEREFAECFARTFSVRAAARSAGFDPRTAFARASRLLEKDEIRALVAECAASFGAGAAKGAPWETDASAAAAVSEKSGRSEENGKSGAADEAENGGLGMAGGSDEAGAARQSEAGISKAAVEEAVGEAAGDAVGRGALRRDGAFCRHGGSVGDGASDRDCVEHGTESDRIIREYEKIAFADASLGEIKVSDKLRALDQYRAMCERRNDGGEISLVVNYDYGE